jgi:sulfopyruvate decarboxylase subunit alpha
MRAGAPDRGNVIDTYNPSKPETHDHSDETRVLPFSHQAHRQIASIRDGSVLRTTSGNEGLMKKSAVDAVIRGLKRAGVSIVCYLPDSLFKELYPALDADPDIRTIRVTNEGEGAAICGGVFLSGKRAALVMENSGLRASVEPLARMGLGAGIPVVMLMSYRGELGENNWWAIPHGITMEPVLDALRIPYQIVREEERIERAIVDAYAWSYAAYYHSAIALGGEVVR